MVEKEEKKVSKGAETNMVAFDFERTPITQVADYIIITASKNNTSDIHFDPREDGMMVRFRIDGDLQDYVAYLPTYSKVPSLNGACYRLVVEFHNTRDGNDYWTYSTIEILKGSRC